jgi:hypothetical protein
LCERIPLDIFRYYDPSTSRFAVCESYGEVRTQEDKVCASDIHILNEIGLKELIETAAKVGTDNPDNSGIKRNTVIGNRGSTSSVDGDYTTAVSVAQRNPISASAGYYSKAAVSGNNGYVSSAGDEVIALSVGFKNKVSTSGDSNKIVSYGDYCHLASAGLYTSVISKEGKDVIAVATGSFSKVKIENGSGGIAAALSSHSTVSGSMGTLLVLIEYSQDGCYTPIRAVSRIVDGIEILPDTLYRLDCNGKFEDVL